MHFGFTCHVVIGLINSSSFKIIKYTRTLKSGILTSLYWCAVNMINLQTDTMLPNEIL